MISTCLSVAANQKLEMVRHERRSKTCRFWSRVFDSHLLLLPPPPPGYGIMTDGYTSFINASTCTISYQPTNPPIVFDLPNPSSS